MVGGTAVNTPGTFDPIAQGSYNPAGTDPRDRRCTGDHAYVFYQVRRRTGAKASRPSSFGAGIPCMCSISHDAAVGRDAVNKNVGTIDLPYQHRVDPSVPIAGITRSS